MGIHSKHFPIMEHMGVNDVREYLKQKQSIIIPVGVNEQHGDHLPLITDALVAKNISRLVGKRTETLVAPVIYTSFSGGGLPGTINISPAVMSLVISDMLSSLAAQGFRNMYIVLCHGGSENARALDNALLMLLRTNPLFEHVMISVLPVWAFGSRGMGWDKALQEHDYHAGWLETSMVMALRPDLVQMEKLALDKEPWLSMQRDHPDNYQHAEKIVDDPCVVPRMSQRPEITVGVMGDPAQANLELGKAIVEDTVVTMAAKIVDLESKADGVYKEIAFTPEPLILLHD